MALFFWSLTISVQSFTGIPPRFVPWGRRNHHLILLLQEGGLLGSQAVAQAYEGRVNVIAMSQVRDFRGVTPNLSKISH